MLKRFNQLLLGIGLLSSLMVGAINPITFRQKDTSPLIVEAAAGTYYSGISDSSTGTTLLSALRGLNTAERDRTVGYSSMGTYYPQTDGDLSHSGNLIAFYSGTSASFSGSFSGNFNREHVWPNSRGGSAVEADIHMTRPTLVAENGSRGNSFYVEGMTSSTSGWDPGAESWGLDKYRGIAARIIFYAVVASSSLSLVDTTNDDTDNKTMGKLSTLLDWNLRYNIDATENQRNEAAQSIQGNRNPFIDHPEYACKIWGDYNTATQNVCAASTTAPTSITVSPAAPSISQGGSQQLTLSVSPSNASTSVTWSSSNNNVATVSSSGLVNAVAQGSATITATSTVAAGVHGTSAITVTAPVAPTSLTMNKTTATVALGSTTTLSVTAAPSGANNSVTWSSSNNNVALVSNGVVSGIGLGSATITATSSVAPSVTATTTITVNQATTTTTSYVFTNKDWGATSNGNTASWTSGKSGNGYLNSGVQISTGSSGAYANSPISFDNVQSVTITYGTNASSGAGTIKIFGVISSSAGSQTGTQIGTTQSVTTSGGTSGRDMVFTTTAIEEAVYIQIYVTTTDNSLYIKEAEIVSGTDSSADPGAEATSWAGTFLSQTSNGCSLQSYTTLSSVWSGLSDAYGALSDAAQMIIEVASPNASGTDVENAKARYLIIVEKYALDNFIIGSGSSESSPLRIYASVETSAFLIFAFASFALSSLAILICLKCRKNAAH